MKEKPIRIGLIQLGDFINVPGEIEAIKKFMNIDQKIFQFETVGTISNDRMGVPELDNVFYSDEQLYNLIENEIKNNIDHKEIEILFAITSGRICEKKIYEKYVCTIDDLDFFSVRDIDRKIGVISVAQWMLNYEDKTYRSTEQFIAFNIIPLLCEFLMGEQLLYYGFRYCIFDKCWDPDQIIGGVKKARISSTSRKQLLEHISHEQIDYFEKILLKVRHPPISKILCYFQETATINLFLIGIVFSAILTYISDFIYITILFSLVFLGLIIWQYYRPSGKLG